VDRRRRDGGVLGQTFYIHTFIDTPNKHVYINIVKIEWDDAKRAKTLKERGLDFADIVTVDWDEALTIEDTRVNYGETRFVTMARIKGRLCVFAWCYRGSALRVISLRKANFREGEKYEKTLRQS
jgi:uncharacterized protein